MRVLVAGATGVIGRQLVPELVAAGHHVVTLARPDSPVPPDGPDVVRAGPFDVAAIGDAVRRARPDAVVDLRTAIPARIDPRHFRSQMALTNRLRSEATPTLIAAAGRDVRVVTEGLAYAYRPNGAGLADERDELWTGGPRPFRPSVAALQRLEEATDAVGGVTLRFGHLYGPGTAFAADGPFVQMIRARRAPIVGHGNAVFSFVHTHDAATAVLAALRCPVRGVLNVVDDDPAPVHDWLPEIARLVAAPPPRRIPTAVARLVAGSWGVAYMDRITGADNRRARRALDWRPTRPTWRQGLVDDLVPATPAATRGAA